MNDAPKPLTPPDCDLRGNEWMRYYGGRLLSSDFDAAVNDAEFRAAHNLWWQAWQQVPAASLPNDDSVLCKLAGLGRDQKTWKRIKKGALHGFILCDDGRLYHGFLSEVALEAYEQRLKYGRNREKARQRLERWRALKADRERFLREIQARETAEETHDETRLFDDETRIETPNETGDETSKRGEERRREENLIDSSLEQHAAPAAPSLEPTLFGDSAAARPAQNEQRQEEAVRSEFEEWWKNYPGRLGRDGKAKKAGKPAAFKEFVKARKRASLQILIAGALEYARSEKPQFIVDPERWLKREKWADEVTEAPTTKQPPTTNWQL